MKFLDIRAFVPSGKDYEKSKEFFRELGFTTRFDNPGYALFEKDDCQFFLQNYDQPGFPDHFMMAVGIDNVEEFRDQIMEKQLPEKYGIKVWPITEQSYGKEVCIADVAGVLWHFVQRQ